MSAQQLSETGGLPNLPCEILLEIFSYLCPMGEAFGFVTACEKFYDDLIVEFYRESGRQLNWLPLLAGISEGNISTLEKCREAGAPLNHRWPYLGVFRRTGHPDCFRFCQPLDWAMWSGQVVVFRWLADRGAVSTNIWTPGSIRMSHTNHFVSDVGTAEGRLKPIMYQQEVSFLEDYPLNPAPYFVWYGHEIKRTNIFPTLSQLHKYQCAYLPSRTDAIYLAHWISWIWVDVLLSSSDPAPILESGFAESTAVGAEALHSSTFRADIFGKESMIGSILRPNGSHFAQFVAPKAPALFSLLLNSGANIFCIASAYHAMLDFLMKFESECLDVFPTFELYPQVLCALVGSGANKDKIENYRRLVLDRFDISLDYELEDWEINMSKMVFRMLQSGVNLADVEFAFDTRLGTEVTPTTPRVSKALLSIFDDLGLGDQ